MLYVACILLGIIAARWLYRPLAALLRALVFILSIYMAFRITALVAPLSLDLDWRGFWGSAALGLIAMLVFGGAWFYLLGWRGRVAATEAEELDRARQKAIRDRKVA
jgi:hypothetical protein